MPQALFNDTILQTFGNILMPFRTCLHSEFYVLLDIKLFDLPYDFYNSHAYHIVICEI